MEKIDGFVNWKAHGWDDFLGQRNAKWQANRYKQYRKLNLVFNLSLLKGSLLDAGCALGDGLLYLKQASPGVSHLVGTDYSNRAIENCRNNPDLSKASFFTHDIHKPFPDRYSNIICLHTLEHVEDPKLAMENLINATRNLLIVAVPYKNKRQSENHLWSFDENDFCEVIDDYCLDKKQKTIYWLVDKKTKTFRFRRKPLRTLQRILGNLFGNSDSVHKTD